MFRTTPTRAASRGFTLVELLVVIGIIALLISILLPSLNRAREMARRIKCLSNMRQLVQAMGMFSNEHQGLMPAGAGPSDNLVIDPQRRHILIPIASLGVSPASAQVPYAMDSACWIAWHRSIDSSTGSTTGFSAKGPDDQNITWSGIAKYLGAKAILHDQNVSGSGNRVNPTLDSLFRCPSDNVDRRWNSVPAGLKYYRYSYSINSNYMSYYKVTAGVFLGDWQVYDTTNTPAPFDATYAADWKHSSERSDGNFNGRIASIKNSAEKILLYCQDPNTLDDAVFTPKPWQWDTVVGSPGKGLDLTNSVHDMSTSRTRLHNGSTFGTSTGTTDDTRGNVVMVDGHGEFMTRKDSLRQIHTGNPYRDPTPAEGF